MAKNIMLIGKGVGCGLFPFLAPNAFSRSDRNAAMNFMVIDEAEARGEGRPERFQSEFYKEGGPLHAL